MRTIQIIQSRIAYRELRSPNATLTTRVDLLLLSLENPIGEEKKNFNSPQNVSPSNCSLIAVASRATRTGETGTQSGETRPTTLQYWHRSLAAGLNLATIELAPRMKTS